MIANSDIDHERASTPPVACPRCLTVPSDLFLSQSTNGNCAKCQLPWSLDNHILQWISEPAESPPRRHDLSRLWRGFNGYFHPLSGRYSPLKQLTRVRKEAFYRRTLTDRGLAEAWAGHYLKGLTLPQDATIFDHGCGRGRTIGLLSQLGYTTFGLEIAADSWWRNLERTFFQVVPPVFSNLPWQESVFNLVFDIEVIHHLTEEQLAQLASNVYRILNRDGYWIILEANSKGWGAQHPLKYYGRLHSLQTVKRIVSSCGFSVIDETYEGFYAPLFPSFINFIRKQCAPWPLDISDYNSRLAKLLPPQKRALWLLRLSRAK
jgi:SAM-dependent methyltransferase